MDIEKNNPKSSLISDQPFDTQFDLEPSDQDLADNPMSQYNQVITCYNNEVNRIGDLMLQKMTESRFFQFVHSVLRKPLGNVILTIGILLLPGFNLVFYGALVMAYYIYHNEYKVYRENDFRVNDPFQNMIFAPELCDLMNRNYNFFDISVQQLDGFTLNYDIMRNIKTRQFEGKVRFMIYNYKFQNYYKDFPKIRSKYLCWIAYSTVLVALSIFLLSMLIIRWK